MLDYLEIGVLFGEIGLMAISWLISRLSSLKRVSGHFWTISTSLTIVYALTVSTTLKLDYGLVVLGLLALLKLVITPVDKS